MTELAISSAAETKWDVSPFAKSCCASTPASVARAMHKCRGKRAAVVTALPKNDLGWPVEDLIMQGGVDVSHVIMRNFDGLGKNTRVAPNFTEKGFAIHLPLGCSDRGHSAASQLKPGEVNWEKLFGEESVRWLVPEVETLITGSDLPVDDGDHTGGGVPCQT